MNKIKLSGTIMGEPTYSHKAFGESLYSVSIEVARTSGVYDTLNCVVSEVLIKGVNDGSKVTLIGEIRTRNVTDGGKKRLQVFAFVNDIDDYYGCDEQSVEIEGYVCKEPSYRETPFGREITDVLIASNRKYGKSDYIPCIAWGRNAVRMSNTNIGDKVVAKGRLQSREYVKKYDDGTEETRTAYELSLNYIEIGGVQDDNED